MNKRGELPGGAHVESCAEQWVIAHHRHRHRHRQ